MATDNIVVGLDIGTSKIAVIIGNTWQGDPEKIEIRGVGTAPSRGLRRGIVVDMELTTAARRNCWWSHYGADITWNCCSFGGGA